MSQEMNLWGGYVSDKDEKLKAQEFDGMKFGLNQAAQIVKFEYITNTGAGSSEGNPAVEIAVKIGDGADTRPINTRVYAPQKMYKGGKEITDVNSEDYKKAFIQEVSLKKGLLVHYTKSLGVTENAIQTAFNTTPPTSFESLAKLFVSLAAPKLATAKVDVFLHYQKDLKTGAEKTYLELPTNLAFGPFIVSHRPGTFEQVADYSVEVKQGDVIKVEEIKGGIAFQSPEGLLHPFKRDKKYAESTRCTQQVAGAMPGMSPMGQAGTAGFNASMAQQPNMQDLGQQPTPSGNEDGDW